MSQRLKFMITTSVSLAFAIAAAPASAAVGGFTPEGQQDWIATVQALIPAPDDGNEAMKQRCVGFTEMGGSAEFRRQAFQVPVWANFAHMWTCHAYKTVVDSGRNVRIDGDTCQSLTFAVKELDKAKLGVDPSDVVTVASQLKDSLISLNRDLKDARACGKRR